ncbi:hypothetical protein SH668x_002900 [Planctomicrobium sp. SH668]|uniref:hypothetical protein n=1 Tax=Planctomicrobium sp. SH668 TaxID=3448126 RepID=UPI003F5B23CE
MLSFKLSRLRSHVLLPQFCGLSMLAASLGYASTADAQITRGFDKVVPAFVPTVELARQSDIWMMEVQFKPMRMVFVDRVDPNTGETSKEQIWYLAWRSIVRKVDNREVDPTQAVNKLDSLPGPRQFIPEFTLITYSDPKTEIPNQILQDEIIASAMREIRTIERAPLLTSVQVVQDLPAEVDPKAEQQPWIYGAATWRGVNPDTRFFKVILGGFTNEFEVRGEDGDEHTWRKVIVQKFRRPGDRFDPNQREFLFDGESAWVFQPDAASDVSVSE